MGYFIKLFIGLIPMIAFAQSNYRTGNITDCYTWGEWAQNYTTLNNISVIPGTDVAVNKTSVKINSVNLDTSTSGVDFIADSMGVDFTGTTTVQCGGVYGEDDGTGLRKLKYYKATSVNCSSPILTTSYGYNSYSVTLGPIKKTGTYKWAKCFAILYNRSISSGTCSSCAITDWNILGSYHRNSSISPTAVINSIISSNSSRIYDTTICGSNYQAYENNFGFPNVTLNEGDYIRVVIFTSVESLSTAGNTSCCIAPLHYLSTDIVLQEQ